MIRIFLFLLINVGMWAQGVSGIPSGGGGGGGGGITGCGFGQTANGTVCDTNTAVIPSRVINVSGVDATCIPASASATVLTCSMAGNALTAYTNGMRVMLRPDVTLSGAPTLNVNALGAKNLYAADGTTAASGTGGLSYWLVYNTALNAAAGGWVFPATGGTTTFSAPYTYISGQPYLFGAFAATAPPAAGTWTLASTQAADAIEAVGAVVRIRMSTASTAINIYSQAIGATRTLTAVVMGDPAFSGDASCYVGVGRAAAGSPTFWQSVDNRSGAVTPQLLGVDLLASPGFGFSTTSVNGIGYAPGTPQFYRFSIAGSDVTVQKSGDYGLSWTTFATKTQTAVFGGAVANTDLWYFGGRQAVTGLASKCTVLSWGTA